MTEYTIKVNHKRFLNKDDCDRLTRFNIKNRLNNAVYHEYTAHIPTIITLNETELTALTTEFNCSVDDTLIVIELGK